MDSARKGDQALADSDCPSAIQYFTRALIEHPRSPSYYIKRSTAFSRLKPADGGPDSHSALRDAEIALTLARERGKRELILSAQMRRGIALYQLERYGDAAFVFDVIKGKASATAEGNRSEAIRDSMAEGAGAGLDRLKAKKTFEQEHPMWTAKVKGKLAKLEEGDEKGVVSVGEFPGDIKIPTVEELKTHLKALTAGEVGAGQTGVQDTGKKEAPAETNITPPQPGQSGNGATNVPSAPPPTKPGPEKVRHEWYQSHDSIVVTLYAKGVPKDKLDSDLQEHSVSLQFPLSSGTLFDFTLDPLYAPIDPSSSKLSVMSTKVEIVLRKQVPGQKWSALEASSSDTKLADRARATGSSQTTSSAPVYPTSSRRGAKDWDKVASELTKKSKSKSASKAAKKSNKESEGGDAAYESDGAESIDSDFGGGDPADAFFKKLYAGADPDTRRAMIKSYTESQGTSLSTNWAEVGKGKVEVQEPSRD